MKGFKLAITPDLKPGYTYINQQLSKVAMEILALQKHVKFVLDVIEETYTTQPKQK